MVHAHRRDRSSGVWVCVAASRHPSPALASRRLMRVRMTQSNHRDGNERYRRRGNHPWREREKKRKPRVNLNGLNQALSEFSGSRETAGRQTSEIATRTKLGKGKDEKGTRMTLRVERVMKEDDELMRGWTFSHHSPVKPTRLKCISDSSSQCSMPLAVDVSLALFACVCFLLFFFLCCCSSVGRSVSV